MKLNINDFKIKIRCQENAIIDAVAETVATNNGFEIYLSAKNDKPEFVEVYWDADFADNVLLLGDAWERSYGDLEFKEIAAYEKHIPWYFIATDKKESLCLGVRTGCNSFVSFKCSRNSVKAVLDCRNGGSGVHLDGRKLLLATFVYAEYDNADVIENLRDFCRKMCDKPILPKERIYGGNNWYYAYGKSNYNQIISDARLQVELSKGIDNKPFQVIDDCWQPKKCCGPWYPNRKFKDMEKLAREIKEIGARPGIWVRLLNNKDRALKKNMRIRRGRSKHYLDPTHPEVQKYIRADIERIRAWGYELIKHDFSTADLFGSFGGDLDSGITNVKGWHFYDKTKTNAEIVLDFYRLIKDACGDMLIIGCNTVSHLSAGLVHLYRTGDDTSGREWERTRKMGVNTLAFRLAQNEIFYMCDADCVGIVKNMIPWEKNSQWLHLLSYSNTPLFISCTDEIDAEQRADIAEAYRTFNEQHEFAPIDIYQEKTPKKWLIDGKEYNYNW